MCFFWEKKTSNVKELGKIMLLDSSTLTPLLKKLQEKNPSHIPKCLAVQRLQNPRALVKPLLQQILKLRNYLKMEQVSY